MYSPGGLRAELRKRCFAELASFSSGSGVSVVTVASATEILTLWAETGASAHQPTLQGWGL
jgi:hypothetical protein